MAKVFIGVKTRGRIIAHLFTWLGTTMQKAKGPGAKPNELETITVYNSIGKPEDVNQNNVFAEFLKTDCTHLLCLDDDIMCDKNLLERLLKYNVDIVASPVLIMGPNGIQYFASMYDEKSKTFEDVDIRPPNNRLQECDAVGFGAILLKREVVERMPDPKYRTVLDEKGFMKTPPDNDFCYRAKELGFQVYVDGTQPIGQVSEVNLMYALQGWPNFVPPDAEIFKYRNMHKWMQEQDEHWDSHNPIVKQVFESGIDIQQLPQELDQLLEFLKDKDIKTYLEIGTFQGGTMLLFSKFLSEYATLISVDVNDMNTKLAFRSSQNVRFIIGNSGKNETVENVESVLNGRKVDLLLIDGDHYQAGNDFEIYRKYVRDGGLIVFHDINKQKSGPATNTGIVPDLWGILKKKYEHREFIAGDPTGYGIGVLEYVL